MNKADVTELLGKPKAMRRPPVRPFAGQKTVRLETWSYGRLPLDSPFIPAEFAFELVFKESELIEKSPSFGGVRTEDGTPTTPELIYPKPGEIFDHYPRIVDFRWQPSLGHMPLDYVVEIELSQPRALPRVGDTEQALPRFIPWQRRHRPIPYIGIALPGKQSYRWRVKAVNATGESDWAAWREFRFAV